MTPNFALFAPEFVLAGVGILVFLVDFITPRATKGDLGWLALVGLGLALVVALAFRAGIVESLYGGLFRVDAYSTFAFGFLVVLGGSVTVASMDYVQRHIEHVGEYFGLLVLSVLGMVVMASAGELLTAYIALELMTFSLYVMVALEHRKGESNEAATKYIVLGALSSATLLYGISMVWGAVGTTTYTEIASALAGGEADISLVVGLALILGGIGFKVAAVPFHMWAPDVYQGAPTPVTAYLAIGSKAAVFIWVLRLFGEGLIPAAGEWRIVVAALATVTMVLGNLVAIVQTNIKRLLAYSSVGQAGYLLAGVAALGHFSGGTWSISELASNGILLHLAGYAVSNLAAFMVVILVFNRLGTDDLSAYSGLARRSPFLAMVLAASLFSLAGLPFFAGFTTKFYLFTAVAQSGFLWLAGIGVAASLVSLYYYLRILKLVYIDDVPPLAPRERAVVKAGASPSAVPSEARELPASEPSSLAEPVEASAASSIPISRVSWALLAALLGAMVLIGVWPQPLVGALP